ncbi:MAG: glycosyltransferase, partial [Azonexus sp.]|nr:glycosyltransferase [Azonexus sp.]
DREQARLALGIGACAYLVCSFGLLGRPKRNLELLQAWLNGALAQDRDAQLVFVGEPTEADYQRQMQALIDAHGLAGRVRITGWVDGQTYEWYLAAADLAVQLRGQSRGETSAAVLDCLNHRLPTLVNDHGSMADLPADAVHHLPDDFSHAQLAAALEYFRSAPQAGVALGARGWALIEREHRPEHCAALYQQALQASACRPAQALRRPRVWVDVSETRRSGRHTGIERVARALTLALCEIAPAGLEVAPVYLSQQGGRWHYRNAHAFAASLFGVEPCLEDEPVEHRSGDRLLLLDLCADMPAAAEQGLFQALHQGDTRCLALVHDLLPVLRREFFPPDTSAFFERWLAAVLQLDGAVCVSQTVAQQLRALRQAKGLEAAYWVAHSAHGADLQASAPSYGMPEDAAALLSWVSAGPCILMVGTLEPRKGHQQALEAFSQLWDAGCGVRLLIVGAEGWRGVADEHRRAIAGLVQRLHSHPQRDTRLRWLPSVSDECLQQLYSRAAGLLAASWDEGFGLPLIEAAHQGVPILARDIAIFREVAGDHARFFHATTSAELAQAVKVWMGSGFHPPSSGLQYLSWRQSAENLLRLAHPQQSIA